MINPESSSIDNLSHIDMTSVQPLIKKLHIISQQLTQLLLGKQDVIQYMLVCALAKGHVLLEDQPGVGKTTLVYAVAKSIGLSPKRIQFTPDLLPADVVGYNYFDSKHNEFQFRPGPIFSSMLLADEINRASAKTQSALLEAMEEGTVSIDGKRYKLKEPFWVVATQNPNNHVGTHPLPESQMDRFMMCLTIGYPDEQAEAQLLRYGAPRNRLNELTVSLTPQELIQLQSAVSSIQLGEACTQYILRLVNYTRLNTPAQQTFAMPLSPRASLALSLAAKAYALLANRHYVIPDDIQKIFPWLVEHRLRGINTVGNYRMQHTLSQQVLAAVDVLNI